MASMRSLLICRAVGFAAIVNGRYPSDVGPVVPAKDGSVNRSTSATVRSVFMMDLVRVRGETKV